MGRDEFLLIAEDLLQQFEHAWRENNTEYKIEITINAFILVDKVGKDFPFYNNLLKIKDKIFDHKVTDKDLNHMTTILIKLIEYLKDDPRVN